MSVDETDQRHLQQLQDEQMQYEALAMAALRDRDPDLAERMMGMAMGLTIATNLFKDVLTGKRKAADAARRSQ